MMGWFGHVLQKNMFRKTSLKARTIQVQIISSDLNSLGSLVRKSIKF